MKLAIVNAAGEVMSYQGTVLVFHPSERERAEAILWLVQRNAVDGRHYQLVEQVSA
jgi:hypothetical protein